MKDSESINTELEDLSEENSDSEKSEKSRETLELVNPEDLELSSETESELSDYNLNELFEEIPQKITLMREIFAKFKNNIITGTSQLQPGSEQSLKNYINQLRVNYFIFFLKKKNELIC